VQNPNVVAHQCDGWEREREREREREGRESTSSGFHMGTLTPMSTHTHSQANKTIIKMKRSEKP
jgi:hypothetical protein